MPLRRLLTWCGGIAVCAVFCLSTNAQPQHVRRDLDGDFEKQLEQLAAKAEELGLDAEAAGTRAWFVRRDPLRQYLFLPDRTEADSAASPLQVKWREKFLAIRSEHAERLFELAREESRRGASDRAYQLLFEVLRQDPRHRRALRISGHRPLTNRSFRRTRGRRAHPRFGWLPGKYWQLESPHFVITTDLSAEAARGLADSLEDLYSVWRQVFFLHWSSQESLEARFAGRSDSLGVERQHRVVLFKDRNEYIARLRPVEPGIEKSRGYYAKGQRTAYLYGGEEDLEAIWRHEVVHQLLQENGNAVPDVGDRWNFWVVEGVAIYFESLASHGGYFTLGGFDADRLQVARGRRFTGDFYLPIAELVRLGRKELQSHPDIAALYTQSAGIVHCLMNVESGRYRPAFARFLAAVYDRRDPTDALATLLGKPFDRIDDLYTEYLQVEDRDLAYLNPAANVRRLTLAATRVTDDAMGELARLGMLRELDLGSTSVGDRGIERIGPLPELRELGLRQTSVTNASMKVIAAMSQLEWLDLSGTAIDDEGIAHLAAAKQLRTLWLAGTRVTDRSLELLSTLEHLEDVDVRGTQVTEAAWDAFSSRLDARQGR